MLAKKSVTSMELSTFAVFFVSIVESNSFEMQMLILTATLPELIAQTNMDKTSVNHLRDELAKITTWLGKNVSVYFANAYEHPGGDYVESARRS